MVHLAMFDMIFLSCSMARIGHSGMTTDEVTENIEAAVKTVMEKIRMVSVEDQKVVRSVCLNSPWIIFRVFPTLVSDSVPSIFNRMGQWWRSSTSRVRSQWLCPSTTQSWATSMSQWRKNQKLPKKRWDQVIPRANSELFERGSLGPGGAIWCENGISLRDKGNKDN